MRHKAASTFRGCYENIPADVRELADKNFQLLKSDPTHSSLHFKKVGRVWSVRVGFHYRAVATPIEGGMIWIWMGTHGEYDKLLA